MEVLSGIWVEYIQIRSVITTIQSRCFNSAVAFHNDLNLLKDTRKLNVMTFNSDL